MAAVLITLGIKGRVRTFHVCDRLGDSLANWQQLLTVIKRPRTTLDTTQTQREHGVCVLDFELSCCRHA